MAKKDFTFEVDVNGNISGLDRAMKEATAVMKRTAQTIKNLDMAIKDDPNDIGILKQRQDAQIRYIKETSKALRELEKDQKKLIMSSSYKDIANSLDYSKLTKEIANTRKELKQAKKDLSDINLAVSNFTFDKKMRAVGEELKKARESADRVKQSLQNIDKAIEFDPYNVQLYAEKQRLLRDELQAVEVELGKLAKQRNILENPLFRKRTENEIVLLDENAKKTAELTERKKALENVIQNGLSPNMEVFARRMTDVSEKMADIANKTSAMSNAFKTFLVSSFNYAKDYETGITSIEKVTGRLSDEIVTDLKNLAIDTGTAFEKVSEYATISGALGLAEDEIVSFTEAMLDLNAVSGGAFSGEEGAKGIAVFLKQLNLSTEEAENFGSAIAVIGDRYADIGDETVRVATKLSGLSSIIDTNQYQLLGLAGVMSDLGLSADTNANAINRAFLQIESALSDTSEKGIKKWQALADASGLTIEQFKREWGQDAVNTFLKFTDGLKSSSINEINEAVSESTELVSEYAKVLDMTADEFKVAWGKDSKKVFDEYIDALGNVSGETESASSVLKTLGISSVNTAQTLLRLAGSGNEVREAIKLTTTAWNENTALQEKTGLLYSTTQKKLESFYESLKQFQASLADSVLPSAKDGLDILTNAMRVLGKLDPVTRKLALAFVAIGSTISPVARGISNFTSSMFKIDKATGEFVRVNGKLQLTTAGTISLIYGAVMALTALGGAIAQVVKSSDRWKFGERINKSFEDNKQKIEDIRQSLIDSAFEWDVNQQRIKQNVLVLDELYKKMSDGVLTEEESKQAKEQLISTIDELNESMGGSFFYWDETTGKIKDEKGEIVGEGGLVDAYKELEIQKKKAMLIDEFSPQVDDAVKVQQESIRNSNDIRQQFAKDMNKYAEEYGKDIVAFAQVLSEEFAEAGGVMQNLSADTLEFYDSLSSSEQQAVWSIAALVNDANVQLGRQQENLSDATNMIQKFDALTNASGKSLEAVIFMLEHGADTSNLVDGMLLQKQLIEEANQALSNRATLSQEEIEAWEKQKTEAEEFKLLLEAIFQERGVSEEELHNEIMRLQAEEKDGIVENYRVLYNPETGELISITQQGLDTMSGMYSTMASSARETMTSQLKSGIDDAVAYGNSQSISIAGHVVWSNLGYSAHSGRVTRTENIEQEQSGGFGFDRVIGSLSRSFGRFNSGGFNSRGINLTANFTINNANNLTNSAMAKEFAQIIVEEINNGLGMEI